MTTLNRGATLIFFVCEVPIYGEESPYFDNFSVKQRIDSVYKHSCSTLEKVVRIYLSIHAGNSQFCLYFAPKMIKS